MSIVLDFSYFSVHFKNYCIFVSFIALRFLLKNIYLSLIDQHQGVFPNRHTLAFDGNRNIFSKTKLPIDQSGVNKTI